MTSGDVMPRRPQDVWTTLAWIMVTMTEVSARMTSRGIREYCLQAGTEVFNASCPVGQVIVMTSAHYGRMRVGKCLKRDYYIGCGSSVLDFTDDRCSGRRRCSIGTKDDIAALHKLQPCPRDLVTYLQAEYTCVNVIERRTCSSQPQVLRAPRGVIANAVPKLHNCHWAIRLLPGQRINVTMMDFTLERAKRRKNRNFCQVYAIIKEKGQPNDVTACGGGLRSQHVYTSRSHEIQLQMMNVNSGDSLARFLIKYQAVGCPTLPASRWRWTRRRGDRLTIHCNHTGETWHLVCRGTKWVGKYSNCTQPGQMASSLDYFSMEREVPYGIVIAIGAGVVLGISLGFLMLCIAVKVQSRLRTQAAPGAARPLVKEQESYNEQKRLRAEYGQEPSTREVQALITSAQPVSSSRCYNTNPVSVAQRDLYHAHTYEAPGDQAAPKNLPCYHEFNAEFLHRLTSQTDAGVIT